MMPQYCHDLITLVTQTTKLALKLHRFTQCGIFICKSHLDFEYKYEKDSFLRENHISHSYILSVIDNVRDIKLETRLQNRRLSSTVYEIHNTNIQGNSSRTARECDLFLLC